MRIEELGGTPELVVDGEGPLIGRASLGDVLTAAFEGSARTVAVDAARLDPAFFDLRTGLAGAVVQRLANYRLRLVVVGELPAEALASRAFSGLVLEGNRGDGPWFVGTLEELRYRLAVRGCRAN